MAVETPAAARVEIHEQRTVDGVMQMRPLTDGVLLDPGQPVTLAGEHVGLVVTEYGVADLRGASPAQKAQALIAVAHPEHRAWLESRGQQA